MTRQEYQRVIEELNFNEHTVAQYLGFSHRMSIRYADGDWTVPQPIAILLRIMAKRRMTKADILMLNYKNGELGEREGTGSRWTWIPKREPSWDKVLETAQGDDPPQDNGRD